MYGTFFSGSLASATAFKTLFASAINAVGNKWYKGPFRSDSEAEMSTLRTCKET